MYVGYKVGRLTMLNDLAKKSIEKHFEEKPDVPVTLNLGKKFKVTLTKTTTEEESK